MDSKIFEIIDKIAAFELRKHTNANREKLYKVYYAGVVSRFFNAKLASIAADTGYTPSGARKLIDKYEALLIKGDVAVNLIETEFQRQKGVDYMPIIRHHRKKKKISLGFKFSHEDELNMTKAIRESILFMHDYGKGLLPRSGGEVYRPNTSPNHLKDAGQWLTLDAASWYCGMDKEIIIDKAQRGEISRRAYKVQKGRTYFEYKVSDLDNLINHKKC